MTLQVQKAPTLPAPIARNIQTNRQDTTQQRTVRNTNNRPKRNDPCWCGSGRKYKVCHMRADAKQGGAPVREVA
ncbi:MAG: SEC-C domain-containing protein [Caldilineaceae bacterium]|nr:SEC-C domain-containing protein [Caldilineaceae bacterium]